MNVFASGLSLVCLLAAAPTLAAGCRVDPYRFFFGQDAAIHMTARSGLPCGSVIRWHNGGATSMIVAQNAANGTTATPSTNSWRYISRAGFVGHDRFVLQTTGEAMGKLVFRGTSNITIDVDVVP